MKIVLSQDFYKIKRIHKIKNNSANFINLTEILVQDLKRSLILSTPRYTTGTTTNVKSIELVRPPIITHAIPVFNSAPLPIVKAIDNIPQMVETAYQKLIKVYCSREFLCSTTYHCLDFPLKLPSCHLSQTKFFRQVYDKLHKIKKSTIFVDTKSYTIIAMDKLTIKASIEGAQRIANLRACKKSNHWKEVIQQIKNAA